MFVSVSGSDLVRVTSLADLGLFWQKELHLGVPTISCLPLKTRIRLDTSKGPSHYRRIRGVLETQGY